MMNKEDIDILEELLTSADKSGQVLRVRFIDNEVYDLTGFAIGQDFGEDYPHCCSPVVEPINVAEEKHKLFSADVAMMFHLSDVAEVREMETGKLLFKP